MTFFRTNQTTIRADLYQGVMDAAAADVSGCVFARPITVYVALSRCTDPANVRVYVQDGNLPGRQGTYTRNVVFRNVL